MLRNCLESVIKTRIPENCSVNITVIDNDAEQAAKPIVTERSLTAPIEMTYIHEAQRGIPVARNKALAFALSKNADYLVFIDDDETVAESWLIELFSYAEQKGGAAVIHGTVISECPPNAPIHLTTFFTKNKFKPTGQSLSSCATDNVLIPLRPIADHQLRFDESRPLAGGTDTIFFCAAHNKGIEIFSCAEAIVHETVPLSRITIKWLSKRKFRAGVDMGKRKIRNGKTVLACTASAILQLAVRILSSAVILLLLQRHLAIKEWLKICRCAGTIYGAFGHSVDSYHSIDGN